MNRTFATLLNWLDERRTKLDYPKFECRAARAARGSWDLDIRHLKVWLYRDARCSWIAQGLDIGYAASAPTLEEAQQKFSRGLASTLVVNMEKFGTIDAIVRPAPPEVWVAWRRSLRAAPTSPKHVATEEDPVVPGLIAPKPRMEISYYGCPAPTPALLKARVTLRCQLASMAASPCMAATQNGLSMQHRLGQGQRLSRLRNFLWSLLQFTISGHRFRGNSPVGFGSRVAGLRKGP